MRLMYTNLLYVLKYRNQFINYKILMFLYYYTFFNDAIDNIAIHNAD